jgi:hypothetical protein
MKRTYLLIAVLFLLIFQAANGQAATTQQPKREVLRTVKFNDKEGKIKRTTPKPRGGKIVLPKKK